MLSNNRIESKPTLAEIEYLLHNFLSQSAISQFNFSQVKDRHEKNQLKQFRLKIYEQQLPYMLTEIHSTGLDDYDEHSFIFAAWYNNQMAASIRLTPHPFETSRFLSHGQLTHFLGINWQSHFLEWSRLIVDRSLKLNEAARALTIYAGLFILIKTSFTQYFGYTKPTVRRVFSRFKLEKETLSFTIPSRGNHPYDLLKGSFITDFQHLQKKLLGR